jgi:hypothetical protein
VNQVEKFSKLSDNDIEKLAKECEKEFQPVVNALNNYVTLLEKSGLLEKISTIVGRYYTVFAKAIKKTKFNVAIAKFQAAFKVKK